ncbi:MAG: thiamine pyrophosphate-dependent enzyme, partial [Verrucomicrobiales bacterium]
PRTYFGSAAGPMRGRDGNVHRGRPGEGIPAMISHLGSLISVVGGILLAKRFKGETGFVGAASIGDGGTSTGAAHEAINLAGVERLPMVVAVANNRYAYSTPVSQQYACSDLVERAPGYGFTGHSVDGTDLDACLEVFGRAVKAARAGEGPQMVVGSLLRLSGHGEHDDASYISEQERRSPLGRDCLAVARTQVLAHAYADETTLDEWDREMIAEVEKGVAIAQKEPGPDPYGEAWQALATSHLNEGIFDQG